MITVLSAAAVASLVGSGHCVAMCSALAVLASQGGRMRLQLSFHVARLVVYGLFGAAAGAIGHGVDDLGALAGIERAATVVAAVMVVVAFAGQLTPKLGDGVRARAQHLLRSLGSPFLRALLMGALTAFVPCGWLYAWVATAAATGDAMHGALLMGVFGLGAVPVLVGATHLTRWLRAGVLARRPRLVAVATIGALLATVALRSSSVAHLHHAIAAAMPGEVAPIVCHGGIQ